MEVVQLMALFFAHITFQIRRGIRSRIFFELKIFSSFFYFIVFDVLRLKPWQHRPSPLFPLPGMEGSVFEYVSRIDSDPAASIGCEAKSFPAWAGIKGWVIGAKAQPVFSITDTDTSQNEQISLNQNYI
jgi:hypothetical protein